MRPLTPALERALRLLEDTHPRPGRTCTGASRTVPGQPGRFAPVARINGLAARGLYVRGLADLDPTHPGSARTITLTRRGRDVALFGEDHPPRRSDT